MKPHKWAKEIKAWADGAEIEFRWKDQHKQEWSKWEDCKETQFYYFDYEFRIKPQEQQSGCCCKQTCSAPKEPQLPKDHPDWDEPLF